MPDPAPLKLGRHPSTPEERARNLKLRAYLPAELPKAPTSVSYAGGVSSWPVYLNDQLGDCLIAGQGHMIEVFTEEVDHSPRLVTDQDILAGYELLGYVPGDPSTDNGGTCVQALANWHQAGLAGDKILGWAEVHPTQSEIETAAWIFSGLYCGFNVPQSAMDQFQAGQPWEVMRDDGGIVGGHCVPIVGYDSRGVTVVTWGALQRASWGFVQTYFDEFYAVIPADDARLRGRALDNGFDLATLIHDLDSIGGNVPPGPTPTPSPVPAPPASLWTWLEQEVERIPAEIMAWFEAAFGGQRA